MVEVLNRRLQASPLRSVHGLSKAVPTVSRSQLYLLLRGEAVIDLAELFAICDALAVSPRTVIADAEDAVAPAVAAYEDPLAIEEEQGVPEEP